MCGVTKMFVGELIEAGALPQQPGATLMAKMPGSLSEAPICPFQQTKKKNLALYEPLQILRLNWGAVLVGAAKALAGREGESGPLRPSHIHAAFQQLSEEGRIPQRVSPRHRRL